MSSGQLLIPIEYLEVPLPAACFLVRPPFWNKSAPFRCKINNSISEGMDDDIENIAQPVHIVKLLRPLPLLQSGKMEPGWKSYSSWNNSCWNNLDAVGEAPGDIHQAEKDAKFNLSSVHFPFSPLSSSHSPSHSSQIKPPSKVPLYYLNLTSWSSEDMLICLVRNKFFSLLQRDPPLPIEICQVKE